MAYGNSKEGIALAINKGWINRHIQVQIGPEQVIMKNKQLETEMIVEGVVCDISLDAITLVQSDTSIVKAVTNRIKNFAPEESDCHCSDKQASKGCYGDIKRCDKRLQLNLAGLKDSLQYELLQLKGCKVKLNIA